MRCSHHLKVCSAWEDGATLDDMLCDEIEEYATGRCARNARSDRDGDSVVRRLNLSHSLHKGVR